jgi:hypothetical protein
VGEGHDTPLTFDAAAAGSTEWELPAASNVRRIAIVKRLEKMV